MKIPREAQALADAALRAQKHAWCGLTDYAVGASVRGRSGKIYPGCNIESPTGILHTCAERAAIFAAVSAGEKGITEVCTASRNALPCGVCRQAILEFGGLETPIYSILQDRDRCVRYHLSELLPRAHTEENLKKNKKRKK